MVSRKELNKLAKENGVKYFNKYSKQELAEKLKIELPESQRTKRIHQRPVFVVSLGKTSPSMTSAAKELGICPVRIYVLMMKGEVKLV